MKLTKEMAYPILQKLTNTLNYNINIMDEQGIIIASVDPNRMDSYHEGAIEVLKTKKALILTNEETGRFSGTKEGVNLPVEFMGDIIGVVGITGKPDEVLELAQITKITVELMLQQMYLQRQAQFEKQLTHSWVLDLINPDFEDEKRLSNHAKHFLKIEVEKELFVILIEMPMLHSIHPLTDLMKRTELIEQVDRHVKAINHDIAFMDVTHHDFMIMGMNLHHHLTEEEVAKSLFQSLCKMDKNLYIDSTIAVGKPYSNISGFRKSYFEAKQTLHLMKKFNNSSRVSHVSEWGIIRLLDQVPAAERGEFLHQYSINDLPVDLKETLNALLECDQNLTLTAEKLHIHRNTLTYRLESIRQILGLNPKSLNDLTTLKILLILQQLDT
ncbi:CdaR family transcriptional regulator [Bacillus salitolerans]|uniref:CdaR family transcriptional regulator n=1 Tax=Bacillus salitolerans TaxID=1437434 RepID=A0ABW4LWF1_9BACI